MAAKIGRTESLDQSLEAVKAPSPPRPSAPSPSVLHVPELSALQCRRLLGRLVRTYGEAEGKRRMAQLARDPSKTVRDVVGDYDAEVLKGLVKKPEGPLVETPSLPLILANAFARRFSQGAICLAKRGTSTRQSSASAGPTRIWGFSTASWRWRGPPA